MEHGVFEKYSENLASAQCFAWTSMPLKTQGDIQKSDEKIQSGIILQLKCLV